MTEVSNNVVALEVAPATATTDMLAVVLAHAETYKDNKRGWDMLLDMRADAVLTDAEILEVIGTTKSDYQAKNRVYKFLQPFVVAKREADAHEAASVKVALAA